MSDVEAEVAAPQNLDKNQMIPSDIHIASNKAVEVQQTAMLPIDSIDHIH